MKAIEVDFNSRDDLGCVPAEIKGPGPRRGDRVDLHDDEGNRCMARVVGEAGGYISLSPEWDTFTLAGHSRVVVADSAPRPDVATWRMDHRYGSPLTVHFLPRVTLADSMTDRKKRKVTGRHAARTPSSPATS
jgi:hypothetical protein